MSSAAPASDRGRQPLLNDALVVLEAPTQSWSDPSGEMGGAAIHGVFHGDWRYVRGLSLRVGGEPVEATGTARSAGRVVFHGVARAIDDETPDPRVLVERERSVAAGALEERVRIRNGLDAAVTADVELAVDVSIANKLVELLRTEDTAIAEEIRNDDDKVDALHLSVFDKVLGETWKGEAIDTVDATLASRYHERFADHAVSIAKKVQYLATGDWVPADN